MASAIAGGAKRNSTSVAMPATKPSGDEKTSGAGILMLSCR